MKRKRSEDDVAHEWRFNKTVRLSIPNVCKVVALLDEPHRTLVRQAGLGIVFELKVQNNVSRVLMCKLMGKIDPDTMRLDCGPNKVLEINREAVHHIFDFPMGSHTAPRPAVSGHDDSLANLKDELGFNRSRSIDVKDHLILLHTLATDRAKVNKTVNVFFSLFSRACFDPALQLGCPG